jgi:hypothetical protein
LSSRLYCVTSICGGCIGRRKPHLAQVTGPAAVPE